jgi:arabinofuranosyltransferase
MAPALAPETTTQPRPRPRALLLRLGLLIPLLALVVGVGWGADDAFITYRVVGNLWAGHGLVWNPGERVQVATHPLWLMLLVALQPVTCHPWLSAMALSVACTAVAAWQLLGSAGSRRGEVTLGAVLLGSKAFVEHAASGLETPLSALLLVVAVVFARADRPAGCCAAAGLLVLNRPDAAIVVGPLVAWALAQDVQRLPSRLALVALPTAAWCLWALAYYGAPWPNPAVAKLGPVHGLAQVPQGLAYLKNTARWDPVTAAAVLVGAPLAGAGRRDTIAVALGLGALFGVVYVVLVGGDFMAGRFLFLPFVAVVAALAPIAGAAGPAVGVVTVVAAALALLGSPRSTLRTALSDPAVTAPERFELDHGIADEQAWQAAGLRMWLLGRDVPRWGRGPDVPVEPVVVLSAVGQRPFRWGDRVHVIDRMGLTDPFLARLPAEAVPGSRPGHVVRDVPEGYLDTLRSGVPAFRDAGLSRCWERVSLATRAPLAAPGRARAVLDLTVHGCGDLLDRARP